MELIRSRQPAARPHALDATFAALAHPTRRASLARLASGETSVLELAEPFAMSQPAISKHLKVLERAGLDEVKNPENTGCTEKYNIVGGKAESHDCRAGRPASRPTEAPAR
jgi:predicted transcriptional regulator